VDHTGFTAEAVGMKGNRVSPLELLNLFYQAPSVQGLLVFQNNEYQGVVFKRDIERIMREEGCDLGSLLQPLSVAQIEEFVFSKEPTPHTLVPAIQMDGTLVRFLTFKELRWYFHPEEFSVGMMEVLLRSLEHPLVVCTHFKRVVYQNQKAFELFESDLLGKNIYTALRMWLVEEEDGFFVVYSDKGRHRLFISHAETKEFSLFVFQFFPLVG